MRFVNTGAESFYEVSAAEKSALTHWFDTVIATAEPEDMTGEVFVPNFVIDEKWLKVGAGAVNAFLKRRPDNNDRVALTDIVITDEDIYETDVTKGIYFDVTIPPLGSGIADFTIGLRHDYYKHPRYTGEAEIYATPPHAEDANYKIRTSFGLKRDLGPNMWNDHTWIDIPADGDKIIVKYACDSQDVAGALLTPKPVDSTVYAFNNLRQHAQFIADILHVPVLVFLPD